MKLHSPINLVIGLIAIVFSGYCFSLDDEGHKMTQVGFGCLLFVIGLIFVKIAFRKPEEEKPVVAPPKPQPQPKAKEKPQTVVAKPTPEPAHVEAPTTVVVEDPKPTEPIVEPQPDVEVVAEEPHHQEEPEPAIVEPQNNTEMKKQETPKTSAFSMNLTYMMFMKQFGLTVVGQVTSGTIKVGDKVVISNGEKEIEDIVTGVNYNRAIHDSYTYDGSDMEIGLLLKSAVRKDLKGDITAYSVRLATAEPVEAPAPEPKSAPATELEFEDAEEEIELEETEEEIVLGDPEDVIVLDDSKNRLEYEEPEEELEPGLYYSRENNFYFFVGEEAPTKENSLYLTMRKEPFEQIVAGTKTVETRELKNTLYKKFIEADKNGDPEVNEDITDNFNPEDFIFTWNNGVCPYIPKENLRYLELAVGYNKDRDTALVEIEGFSFEPATTKSGVVARFNNEEEGFVYTPEGQYCHWLFNIHIKRVVECHRH